MSNSASLPHEQIFRKIYAVRGQKNSLHADLAALCGVVRYPSMAFTELGVAMHSSVLKSRRSIDVTIQILRVFVKMRQMVISYKDLLEKIEKPEASDLEQNKHSRSIYSLIKELLEPVVTKKTPIGFRIRRDQE